MFIQGSSSFANHIKVKLGGNKHMLKEFSALGTTTSGGPVVRLCPFNSGDPGLIPTQGTRSHMLQLRPSTDKYIKKIFFKEEFLSLEFSK